MHTALNGQTRVGIWQNGKRIKWLEQAKLTNMSTNATTQQTNFGDEHLLNNLKHIVSMQRNSELSQS